MAIERLFIAIENRDESLASRIFETGECDLSQVNSIEYNALMLAIINNMETLTMKILNY